MKKIKYILLAFVSISLLSCMGEGFDEPNNDQPPFGNNGLKETNLMTIGELLKKHKSLINDKNEPIAQFKEEVQIKGRVVGNDIGGNIYQTIYIQDETGAIPISVAEGGINGYMPLGQEVLVELKDLYIGAYRRQGQIGQPYNASIGRMSRALWKNHFKLIGRADPTAISPMIYDNNLNMDENCGRLMTIKNVTLTEADGKAAYAPSDGSVAVQGGGVSRNIDGNKKVVLRTSAYAKFANDAMLTGKVDITGVFSRYNTTWQILMRTANDIKPAE